MTDELFMRRALELAALGAGSVSPNPMVGCVIVHEGRVIGSGYHRQYGGPHAEVNAVAAVREPRLLRKSTVYVTLEPCAHFGKTPPCADLLVKQKVKKVVVCNGDPNPLVAGQGLARLRTAGIEVVTGVLEAEGRWLNRRFFTAFEKKRPYVILKWAQTEDGFIARENFDSKWISNAYSRQLVHKWRTEEDAILVGSNTALFDNPSLTARDWHGRNPVRVVLDRQAKLSADTQLLDGTVRTLYFTEKLLPSRVRVDYLQPKSFAPADVLAALHQQKIQSVIVEGGSQVLTSFIQDGMWDEARVFAAPVRFERGIPGPPISGELISERDVMGDRLLLYRNSNG